MPDDKWPLIPDVAKLTEYITNELKSKTAEKNNFDKLIDEVILSNLKSNTIDEPLSNVKVKLLRAKKLLAEIIRNKR